MKSYKDPLFPIYQVNAFAHRPFTGNPAAVVFMMGKQSDAWMQSFAKEMNLSETAFFMRKGDRFTLRWFTPTNEVDLCGHATLATAHIIYETELLTEEEEIRFETKSGILRARKSKDWIHLDFPAEQAKQLDDYSEIEQALGQKAKWAGSNRMDYLVELDSEQLIHNFKPNFHALGALGQRGIIITAKSAKNNKYDFVSRFFGPSVGVNEDPVTGSAHCALAPYWADLLKISQLTGYQASERGGFVKVRNKGSRVELIGKGITMFQGVISSSAYAK